MGSENSFDIMSKVDLQEVDNAVNQAVKEMRNRFDFRGSRSAVTLARDENQIEIIADDEMKLRNIKDIVATKLAKRSVSLKSLNYKPEEKAFDGTLRQVAEIQQGIPQERAKQIVKMIKELKLKVQASIQGDQIRVSGKKKDDLQTVMCALKSKGFDLPLQFTNYR